MRPLLWMGVGACLLGCQPAPPGEQYGVFLDPAFTTSQQQVILTALDAWTQATGVSFSLTNACAPTDYQICLHPVSADQLHRQDPTFAGVPTGLTYRDYGSQSSQVWLLSSLGEKWWLENTEHEIGHALGLEHTESGTLMYAYLGTNSGIIVCQDQQQYAALRGKSLQCGEHYQLSGQ